MWVIKTKDRILGPWLCPIHAGKYLAKLEHIGDPGEVVKLSDPDFINVEPGKATPRPRRIMRVRRSQ